MVVGNMDVETEVLVIGAGPGGYVAAIRAAQLGKEVMIIDEQKQLGGVCLRCGCIPSKALIHASEHIHKIQHMDNMGISVGNVKVDPKKLFSWKASVTDKLTDGIAGLCKRYGIEVITAKAVFESNTKVLVEGKTDIKTVSFKQAIIATGSSPIEIPGFSGDDVLSSKEALSLEQVPKKLVVIGGGYIGTELGTMFAKLGSSVHIVEMADRIIPQFDQDLTDVVTRKFKSFGIELHTKAKALGFEKGKVEIEVEDKKQKLDADKVLVVVGRKPNSKDLGLEAAGISVDEKGFITVDNQMRTSQENVFAIGDVAGQPMLAHKASKEAKVAAEVIAGMKTIYDSKAVPAVVFNDPEIVSVGLSESEAKDLGKEISVGKFPYAALGKALAMDSGEGFVKVVADKQNGYVLGVHAVGPHVSEIVSEATLAIEMGATAEDLALTIHPHPTVGESVMEAAEVALGEAIHIFNVKK